MHNGLPSWIFAWEWFQKTDKRTHPPFVHEDWNCVSLKMPHYLQEHAMLDYSIYNLQLQTHLSRQLQVLCSAWWNAASVRQCREVMWLDSWWPSHSCENDVGVVWSVSPHSRCCPPRWREVTPSLLQERKRNAVTGRSAVNGRSAEKLERAIILLKPCCRNSYRLVFVVLFHRAWLSSPPALQCFLCPPQWMAMILSSSCADAEGAELAWPASPEGVKWHCMVLTLTNTAVQAENRIGSSPAGHSTHLC